jgi:F5/8 type C domain
MKLTTAYAHAWALALLLVSAISLTACGGVSGGTGAGVLSPAVSSSSSLSASTNVAASVNGGVASATFDSTHASYVNDGDTSNVFYWVGNVATDYVMVTFNRVYAVTEIKLHTNAANTTDTKLQASSDGTTFSDLSYTTTGSAGDCFSVTISAPGNLISCGFGTTLRSLRAVRVVILTNTNISMKQVREIEVTGQ